MLGADEAPYHVVLLFLGFLAFCTVFIKAWKGGGFRLHLDPPIWIFAGFIALGLFQITPIPLPIVKWLSPKTFDYRVDLLPNVADQYAGDALPWSSYATISFHPYGTKQFIFQIIALAFFYIISRSSSNKVKSATTLCWCLMANGSIMALFAISQSFTSPSDMVYWSMPFAGSAFGPMNRDHYPDYMTLCIGASCALLTTVYHRALTPIRDKRFPRSWERMMQPFWDALRAPLDLLQSPGNLWILLGLIFMIASVPMSGSRGGVGGMALGFLIAGGLASQNLKKGGFPTYILWLFPIIIGFFAVVGWSFLESRVVSASTFESFKKEGRWKLWYPLLGLGGKFPIFGTGFGTFLQAEQLVRTEELQGLTVDYAHNEYLEALVEGGAIRLLLSLMLVLVVIQKAIKALQIHRNEYHALLPAGICWGLIALAIHSFLDFGVHLPAVAITAVVLLAKLHCLCDPLPIAQEKVAEELGAKPEEAATPSPEGHDFPSSSLTPAPPGQTISASAVERGLGSVPQNSSASQNSSGRRRRRRKDTKETVEVKSGDYGVYIAGFLLLTFVFVLGQSVVYARVESLMVASRTARGKGDTTKEIAYLNDALRIAPANALVHEALGISLTLMFNDDVAQKNKLSKLIDSLTALDTVAFLPFAEPVGLRAQSGIFVGLTMLSAIKEKTNRSIVGLEQEKKKHFKSAVYALEKARVLFPILYRVHSNLAILAPIKNSAASDFVTDLPSVHLRRALECFPSNIDLNFSMGQSALLEGDRRDAGEHFRKALERGGTRLDDISRIVRGHYSLAEILNFVFPQDPDLILRAMPIIAPRQGSEERVAVLLKVLSLVSQNRGKLEPPLIVAIFNEMSKAGIPPELRLGVIKDLPPDIIHNLSVSLEIGAVYEEAGQFLEALPHVYRILEKNPKSERAREILIAIKRYCKIFDINFDEAIDRIKRDQR